ncbi:RagB/SusD family nutrient uptake outer membrane protein [Olivibacter sp. SDN3]|uniref:RagB/SusD family nutrient uptake outer membrane protein n=1 Tax=Olivibacter sp. SDN3 TaxID=2764720 RepID=UPI0016519DEE|nr:RagB/SusD family nutrient uptake outer membrane protein [Olivibacter sp. SDN3]QNL49785.1 RagB/SusD family nutrient uptake outer membrane protein [Olivibacter sp. SDN3]
MRTLNIFTITILMAGILSWRCSKLIEVGNPKNQLIDETVFNDSLSAVSALVNTYAYLGSVSASVGGAYINNISLYTDEYSLTTSATDPQQFFQSTVSIDNATNKNIWTRFYEVIYSCNNIIEKVSSSNGLTETTKNLLSCEAKFLRGYSYFYLQNLYDNVPLILSTDVNQNRLASQADSSSVYDQIISDLNDAKNGLQNGYQGTGKVRANKWAAIALLARIYLYKEDWEAAEKEASSIISSDSYFLSDASSVFYAGSDEAILQLWTQNGFVPFITNLIPPNPTSIPNYPISMSLYNDFEDNDLRKRDWLASNTVTESTGIEIIYYYPNKYKNNTNNTSQPEYLMVLRLGEIYLIRAEARSNLNNVDGAIEDINSIRYRAGLNPLSFDNNITEIQTVIKNERKLELFGEWGHRFMDLKRSGTLDNFMEKYKSSWRSGISTRLPIPQDEITYNPNLFQNSGY